MTTDGYHYRHLVQGVSKEPVQGSFWQVWSSRDRINREAGFRLGNFCCRRYEAPRNWEAIVGNEIMVSLDSQVPAGTAWCKGPPRPSKTQAASAPVHRYPLQRTPLSTLPLVVGSDCWSTEDPLVRPKAKVHRA